jgi:hypothetical protein
VGIVQKKLYKPELAKEAQKAAGNLSISQVAYKTDMAYESARKLIKMGHVPSEDMLERFAKGLNYDLRKLRVAAGYEQPTNTVDAVEVALRVAQDIPDQGKEYVRKFVNLVVKNYAEGKDGSIDPLDMMSIMSPESEHFTQEMQDFIEQEKQRRESA